MKRITANMTAITIGADLADTSGKTKFMKDSSKTSREMASVDRFKKMVFTLAILRMVKKVGKEYSLTIMVK